MRPTPLSPHQHHHSRTATGFLLVSSSLFSHHLKTSSKLISTTSKPTAKMKFTLTNLLLLAPLTATALPTSLLTPRTCPRVYPVGTTHVELINYPAQSIITTRTSLPSPSPTRSHQTNPRKTTRNPNLHPPLPGLLPPRPLHPPRHLPPGLGRPRLAAASQQRQRAARGQRVCHRRAGARRAGRHVAVWWFVPGGEDGVDQLVCVPGHDGVSV